MKIKDIDCENYVKLVNSLHNKLERFFKLSEMVYIITVFFQQIHVKLNLANYRP